nr:hypothetical protein [uncultured Blautia sp.]
MKTMLTVENRFHHKINALHLVSVYGVLCQAGDKNNTNCRIPAAYFMRHLKPVAARHLDIQKKTS